MNNNSNGRLLLTSSFSIYNSLSFVVQHSASLSYHFGNIFNYSFTSTFYSKAKSNLNILYSLGKISESYFGALGVQSMWYRFVLRWRFYYMALTHDAATWLKHLTNILHYPKRTMDIAGGGGVIEPNNPSVYGPVKTCNNSIAIFTNL